MLREGGELYFLLGDHLGSTSVSYRVSDGQTVTQTYHAWGDIRPGPANALPTDYAFTGQRLQGETGLYQMGARWYDALTGRWLSADTIIPGAGNPQSLNRYSYCLNNPLAYVDPSGHWLETAWDIACIAWDIYEIKRNPSAWNIGALVLDVALAIVPFLPGGIGLLAKGGKVASHADEVADAVRLVDAVDDAADVARAVDRAQELGRWVPEASHMSRRAADYQEFITRGQRKVFELRGVRFDGFRNGTLLEAKGYLKQFIDPATGSFRNWFTGKADLINQALRQLGAAQGVPIEWHFNEPSTLEAVRRAFIEAGVSGIELIYSPLPLP